MAQASDECLYELNPMGGLTRQHSRFCGVQPCDEDAVVHIRVIDRGWCANVCRKCELRIGHNHRIRVTDGLRGLEGSDAQQRVG